MENTDPNFITDFLQNPTDGAGVPTINLFPQELITTLTIGFIVLNIVAILFFIAYVVNSVRKWKVQSAILDMQKDVKEIKENLAPHRPQAPIDTDTSKIA